MKKSLSIFTLTLILTVFLQAEVLRFAVLSDTNPPFLNQKDFSQLEWMCRRVNALKPDLVIHTGDMIYGYGLKSTRTQWDRYLQVIKCFEPPYHQIPGNHDVFNQRARQIYLDIFKRTYYSFDYKNYHFVLLDNLEDGQWGKIGEEQLRWLEEDLKNPRWEGAFVFVHIPVWDLKARNVRLEWREFWFEKIHPLLLRSRVRAVFAGHTHRFGPTRIYDGLMYYVAGGGNTPLHKDYVRAGGRNFFLLVEVTENGFRVNVVLEDRIISEEEADLLKEAFEPYYFKPGNHQK
ncbi:MAG: metallophosphoesterase [Candidatus Saccharicenans sp.]